MPAQAYNPLFVCGPPGVGKTHLMSAIANLVLSHSPELAVTATTGEAFTNDFLAALSGRQTDSFKARFRHIDVLLVDDVQFLERKTKTEEEFFHTFNALQDGGRQIVLTSDRPPRDLQALEDRLRERFQAGLVAEVKPPDRATRLTILAKRAAHDHLAARRARRPDGDRRPHHRRHQIPRGSPHPRRGVRLLDRAPAHLRSRTRGARRALPRKRLASRNPQTDDRGHTGRYV